MSLHFSFHQSGLKKAKSSDIVRLFFLKYIWQEAIISFFCRSSNLAFNIHRYLWKWKKLNLPKNPGAKTFQTINRNGMFYHVVISTHTMWSKTTFKNVENMKKNPIVTLGKGGSSSQQRKCHCRLLPVHTGWVNQCYLLLIIPGLFCLLTLLSGESEIFYFVFICFLLINWNEGGFFFSSFEFHFMRTLSPSKGN